MATPLLHKKILGFALLSLLSGGVTLGLSARTAHAERGASASLSHGHDDVTTSMNTLRERWHGATITRITPLGGRSAKVLEVETAEKKLFIVRRPRRDVEHGLRVNIATHKMAAAMGDERMVPAAIIDTTPVTLDADSPAGSQVLVTRHIGHAYTNANQLHPTILAKLPERSKLVAAIIDLLSEQQDRKSENIMVRKEGTTLKMIDPDKSFGQRHGRIYRSQFFHGGMVGYTSAQNKFTDLPADLQTYIGELATATPAQIQTIYGLNAEESAVVSNRAQRVQALGLRPAIDEYVVSLGQLHAPE